MVLLTTWVIIVAIFLQSYLCYICFSQGNMPGSSNTMYWTASHTLPLQNAFPPNVLLVFLNYYTAFKNELCVMTLEKGLGFLSCYQWHMTVVTDSQQYSNWINLKKQQTSMRSLGGGWAVTYLQKGCQWTVFLPRDSLWLLNTFKPVVEGLNTPEVRSLRPFPSCAFFSLLELHLSRFFFFFFLKGYEKEWKFWYLLLELHRSRRILTESQTPFSVAFEKLTHVRLCKKQTLQWRRRDVAIKVRAIP